MYIFPAIDLFDKKAVRLYKGNYQEMTVYSDNPVEIALDFKASGAEFIHVVDLEGAKDGTTPNIDVVRKIAEESGLFVEIGGGIRTMEVLQRYFERGVSRAILGTAAVNDEEFLKSAISKYGDKIAVGADVKDGYIAIKGWVEKSEYTLDAFFEKMQKLGVKTVICTDISKDGAMRGTNLKMYKELSEKYVLDIVASGGVSSLDDVRELAKMNMYGAIIGKAYYTGAVSISDAVKVAKEYDN
ncbi:MAG: 1-(5-phosphoribosyl)-5-[(5-phosphoribosylamino)methylideneamino]imidazole-4-carboxamide isomerase [Ruminococcaceae bacterium]|nr:1-(5-phosphoribosyl)-5-[(5-phosphoribosylamino)methylideneamino]imidazole-4-carboxamide isomerase [Oscillospiraceae bacterium]